MKDLYIWAKCGIVMTMKTQMEVHTVQAYRQQLYESFEHRVDARMDLIDALLSNATDQAVAALSLSPFFRRQYSSITGAIDAAIPPHLDATTARRQQGLSLTRLIGLSQRRKNVPFGCLL